MDDLRAEADKCDAAIAQARDRLVAAVRRAHAAGMSQRAIAEAVGRSQPEVSRLLHFHGRSPLARRLRRHRGEIRRVIGEAGGQSVRVFGSVATGTDHAGSDVDLLFSMTQPLSLMALSRLEARIADVMGVEVDLVPEQALRPDLRERVLAEAVAL